VKINRSAAWNRDRFPAILTMHGYQVGAEIGVQAGEFSRQILDGWPGKLYMIDCWRHQDEAVYHDVANVPDELQAAAYQQAQKVAAAYWERAVVIREFSQSATRLFKDGSLDFVYLDGNHSYQATLADLTAWWPKIRNGGLMSGHDFKDEESHGCSFHVKPAVEKFFGDILVQVAGESWPSWYVFKGVPQ
jgi:hypothetical protein